MASFPSGRYYLPMTNKNKKSKKLVNTAGRKSSDIIATIPTLTQAVSRSSASAETALDSVDFANDPARTEVRTESGLKQLAAAQSARIADLEFRLEESRIRQRGLDEELTVREDITSDINREIREARKQLMTAADELQNLNQKYTELRARHDETESRSKSLQDSLDEQQRRLTEKDGLIAELEATLTSTSNELSDLRNYVDGRKAVWSERDAQYAVMQAELEQVREESRMREKASRKDLSRELVDNRRRIAKATGEIAAKSVELETLRKDNERYEAYSNELRIKLQDQVDAVRESTHLRKKLEGNLEIASEMIADLSRQLETERAKAQVLREAGDKLRSEHEREKRQIRLELTTAQHTINEQETVNRTLSSDLVDNQGFLTALESHVEDIEQKNSRKLARIENELRQAQSRVDNYERKLSVKDGAIADLMQELADQSSKMKFTDELENALQKIDGRKTAQTTPRRPGERVTRQLIGSADGKELQFPLFRKRLSIGRTRHNDIQLDLRFVSRRHAVIATENNHTRIIDWGSRNGVYVNKKRITEKILESGDVITIGLTNLRYEERPKR